MTKPSRYGGVAYYRGAKGWVVAHTYVAPSGRALTSWWFGPDQGWGTTYGGLAHPGPQVWRTKHDAEMALRAVYGTPSHWRGRVVVRVADAELIHDAQSGGPS